MTCLNVEGSEKWGLKWSKMKSFRGMCVLWLIYTRWFKYDRDKLWLVYTQIVPVIFEPPCSYAVRTWVTVYYVVWFLFCIFCFCYVLITRSTFFIIRFTFVLLSILCVLCFCTVLCVVSPYVYSRFFSICVQSLLTTATGWKHDCSYEYHESYNTLRCSHVGELSVKVLMTVAWTYDAVLSGNTYERFGRAWRLHRRKFLTMNSLCSSQTLEYISYIPDYTTSHHRRAYD
jgi:hypothetical protein